MLFYAMTTVKQSVSRSVLLKFVLKEWIMPEGIIKRLTDKGFGFIDTGQNNDLFFHLSNLDGVRFEELQEGQRVSYTEGQGPKGPRAENVKPV